MDRLKFEQWVVEYTSLPADRDEDGYTDFTVAILRHAWKAAIASVTPNWPNHAAAIADPVFHQLRGIMGTENFGQEDALRQAVLHLIAVLGGTVQPPSNGD